MQAGMRGFSMYDSIVGAVLAGGQGRRMGSDKASLLLDGMSLAERALSVLAEVFPEVVLSASGRGGHPEGWRVVSDRVQDRGPLAGLDAVLRYAGRRSVFLLACDLPLVGTEIVRAIVAEAASEGPRSDNPDRPRAWVARGGRGLQPLCGLYNGACLAVVERSLAAGFLSMRELLSRIEVTEVPLPQSGTETLLNVNRPEDLELARRALDGKQ
jgi:molybdopterin-guanine dinucleotide biosynthesis protein A